MNQVISRSEAKLTGSKHYFTGKPCLRGHISIRLTSTGSCKECSRENNPKEYQARKYNSQRKEYMREYMQQYQSDNAKYRRRYYQNNKSSVLEKTKQYRESRKGFYNHLCQQRRERIKIATPSWVDDLHMKKIDKIYIQCGELNQENKNSYHVDHIIPLSGKNVCGLHVIENLQIITKQENLRKSDKWIS